MGAPLLDHHNQRSPSQNATVVVQLLYPPRTLRTDSVGPKNNVLFLRSTFKEYWYWRDSFFHKKSHREDFEFERKNPHVGDFELAKISLQKFSSVLDTAQSLQRFPSVLETLSLSETNIQGFSPYIGDFAFERKHPYTDFPVCWRL